MYNIYRLVCVQLSLHVWDKVNLIMVDYVPIFDLLLLYLGFMHLYSSGILVYSLFVVVSLTGFGIRVKVAS